MNEAPPLLLDTHAAIWITEGLPLASGAVEAVASIMAIRSGVIPPTIHYEIPDPECDLDYVPNQPRTVALKHVMSNSFGFGGHNATLVFSRFEG